MFCNNCGKQIESNSTFCSNCGMNLNNPNNNQPNNKNGSNILEIISLIIGSISVVLAIFLNVFIIPLAVIGLILGIIARKKKRCCGGIILNIVAIVMSIVILIIFLFLYYFSFSSTFSENDVSGHYNCINFPNGINDSKEYSTTLQLNKDYTFLYGPYGKLDNNYVKGTYTYIDEKKTNNNGEYKYYMITFNSEYFIVNGEEQTKGFNPDMEFGITTIDGKRQGITFFAGSENMYYCYAE